MKHTNNNFNTVGIQGACAEVSRSFGNAWHALHCIDVLKEKFAKAFVAEKNYALHVKARRNMVGTSKRKVTAATDDFADTFQLSLSLAILLIV